MKTLIAKYEDHKEIVALTEKYDALSDKAEAWNKFMEELNAPHRAEGEAIRKELKVVRKQMWDDIEVYLIKKDLLKTTDARLQKREDGIYLLDEDGDDDDEDTGLKGFLGALKKAILD